MSYLPVESIKSKPKNHWHAVLLSAVFILWTLFPDQAAIPAGTQTDMDELRQNAGKNFEKGNFKDALTQYRNLLNRTDGDPGQAGHDLDKALTCLTQLNQQKDMDELLEKAIQVHQANWQLLWAAANGYQRIEHFGTMIAGRFERGPHRGIGKYVNSFERDRVRALQLMFQAMNTGRFSENEKITGGFFHSFAQMWIQDRNNQESAWQLQVLTDIATLLDYQEGYFYPDGQTRGAPVDPEGNPVFYQTPASLATAKNDGERWRWCLMMAKRMNPDLELAVNWSMAVFFRQQFGVQTMANYGWWQRPIQDEGGDEGGIFAVHTLSDQESIAKLAAGIKRFTLPDEYNYITIFKVIAGRENAFQANALQELATIYENRRMYEKSLKYWQQIVDLPDSSGLVSPHAREHARKQLSQIRDNWGQFEPVMTQPYGKEAGVEFRFRNADKVDLQAYAVRVPELLDDVIRYIKKRPRNLDWQKIDVHDIGWRLVEKDEKKYIGWKTAGWSMRLSPGKNHWDRRVTINTPLQKAGAYLLVATLPGGHTSRIVIWLNDTVIVNKPLSEKNLYYVADAVTGKPLPHMKLEFFGYHQRYIEQNLSMTDTQQFAEFSDADGLVLTGPKDQEKEFQWLITARDEKGRFAYLGFNSVWYPKQYDPLYNETKVFTITDRPVYRPGQSLEFKQWVGTAKYDQDGEKAFSDQEVLVEIINPKGDRIFEKKYSTDSYGGISDRFPIPSDATLGQYQIYNKTYGYGESFRVEEYKKPEFEVMIEAPEKPVMLGEKITVDIRARYYFGEPVTKARLKYKILRYNHSARWYPEGKWDWFYEPGYWWFSYDSSWYPGWETWGCPRPSPWWIYQPEAPPEIVAENEAELSEDGKIGVEIDTRPAKEIHGDQDHRYEITAEVTDPSRRTITGKGSVLVARRPFTVYAWVDRGHYRVGDNIRADFSALTLDQKPVQGQGKLVLYQVTYDKNGKPAEHEAQKWNLNTDAAGVSSQQIRASEPGQYRLSYTVSDANGHRMEGGYLFTIMGEGAEAKRFRFNPIELIADRREYAPLDTVRLQVNTDHDQSSVLLFLRPSNGVYLPPKMIHLNGKTMETEIRISNKDMPNFFVEALTISDGKIHSTIREVIVPPEKRILNLEIQPSSDVYKPGEEATIALKLTDADGDPFVGSAVISIYDKALEYISGGSNIPDIKEFFWKWRRSHQETGCSNLDHVFRNLINSKETAMQNLGVFGHMTADMNDKEDMFASEDAKRSMASPAMMLKQAGAGAEGLQESAVFSAAPSLPDQAMKKEMETRVEGVSEKIEYPVIRTMFADTAFWDADVKTDETGVARIRFSMPENLTGWKVKSWAMGHETRVGEAETLLTTRKNLMIRLQAPRFFIEKDEVVLSANINNYLEKTKKVQAVIELKGDCLAFLPDPSMPLNSSRSVQEIVLEAGTEKRADWRVQVIREGTAVIRMQALTDEESDAVEMQFPVYVHGADTMKAWSGHIRPEGTSQAIQIDVPEERLVDSAHLEVRYSPTLAGAMVDALPYLADYPYGCTEQTLNRFLPTVITQKILLDMGLDLADIEKKRSNLNAQEIGNDDKQASGVKKLEGIPDRVRKNPVFDSQVVQHMVKTGVKTLTGMQLEDGGWGWFSGYGEHSFAHTTAYVVHGLQKAKENDVALISGVLERGLAWLENYEKEQVRLLKVWDETGKNGKSHADNLDAFLHMVLTDGNLETKAMGGYLYRDRNHLSVYGKAMAGMAFHQGGDHEKRDMLMQNIEQYLIRDEENQTAYLNMGNSGYWWYWYGSEYEAHAYYLKLLSKTGNVHDWKAPGLVKYLLNNRKHSSCWESTRDTAVVIESFADYLKATKEHQPDLFIEILVDGEVKKQVNIKAGNLFWFDDRFVLTGDAVKSGKHTIELRKKGKGDLYFNTYLRYFSLQDFIPETGLEVKVQRQVYKLNPVDQTIHVAGSRGQAVSQKTEKVNRELLEKDSIVKSGDLVEVELTIQSKNDYEYLIFEDFKAAGFEPVDVRSGYNGNEMGAYVEFRDNRVVFFVRHLARGIHSVSYRLRAETPGRFSALPAQGYAMYAPELRGNSNEIKLKVVD